MKYLTLLIMTMLCNFSIAQHVRSYSSIEEMDKEKADCIVLAKYLDTQTADDEYVWNRHNSAPGEYLSVIEFRYYHNESKGTLGLVTMNHPQAMFRKVYGHISKKHWDEFKLEAHSTRNDDDNSAIIPKHITQRQSPCTKDIAIINRLTKQNIK